MVICLSFIVTYFITNYFVKKVFFPPQLNHEYPANENVDVYFISMRWFRLWEMFVKGQEDGTYDLFNIVTLITS